MKRFNITLLATMISLAISMAQNTMCVHQKVGGIAKYKINNVDSITFEDLQIPSDGLVAWYPFNGNANDESANGNNGIVNGATLTTDRFGNNNSAYSFDGINDYIEIPNNNTLQFTTNQSICFWIKISALPTDNKDHSVIDKLYQPNNIGQQSYGFHVVFNSYASDNYFRYRYMNGNNIWGKSDIPYSQFPVNNFVFIAFTTDNSICKVYMNNILMGTFNVPVGASIGLNSNSILLGKGGAGFTNANFMGIIDDLGIWNRTLTQEEITELYNAK